MIPTAQLREDYVGNKMSMRAISAKYGISLGAVHKQIAMAGIAPRKAGRPVIIGESLRPRIVAMRKNRHSIVHIAAVLGVSRQAVWNFLKAEGLPMFPFKRAA